MARPPILRRALASAVLAIALIAGLRRPPSIDFPFAAVDLEPGTVITAEMVARRQLPAGFLPESHPVGAQTLVPIAAGRPLTEEVVGSPTMSPAGWWALELPVPAGLAAGAAVQLVISPVQGEAVLAIPGLATAAGGDDELGETTAMVAVPASHAALVAVAARDGRVTVLVGAAGS
jgi:hypothetical protein